MPVDSVAVEDLINPSYILKWARFESLNYIKQGIKCHQNSMNEVSSLLSVSGHICLNYYYLNYYCGNYYYHSNNYY